MSRILITGADGYLGNAIATWLLDHSEQELVLWTRASDESSRAAKRQRLQHLLRDPRCQIAFGDLEQAQPFANVDTNHIDSIVHAAAAIDFNVSRELAERVNIDGTHRLLKFAACCPNLKRFAYLGTLYSAGLCDGELTESLHSSGKRFANHYEWSKHRAEQIIASEFDFLPWQIMRVATLIADNESGEVGQQNVLHNTMRLMYYGLLSILPGIPSSRIYLTTKDFVAAACGHLLLHGPERQVFHLSDDGQEALKLGELLDRVYAEFQRDEKFGRSGILKPLFCDQRAFNALVSGISRQSDVIGQALASVAPFAPQLFHDKIVDTKIARACLGEIAAPRIAPLLTEVSHNLISNRWGLAE